MAVAWSRGLVTLALWAQGAYIIYAQERGEPIPIDSQAYLWAQFMILAGIMVNAIMQYLTHRWDKRDRDEKQAELRREVEGTGMMMAAQTRTAAEEVKSEIKGNGPPAAEVHVHVETPEKEK